MISDLALGFLIGFVFGAAVGVICYRVGHRDGVRRMCQELERGEPKP